MTRRKRRHPRTRAATWMVCAALAVGITGCGPGPRASTPDGTRTGPVPSAAITAPTVTVSGSSGPDLAAVDDDGQVVDAASTQSDADFGAGVSAQAQQDQP